MKIELKKIEYSARLSEETNAFSADLYIDGKKAGIAYNRGHGGPTDYVASNDAGIKLIKKAEEYCKGLPPEKLRSGEEEHSLAMDLELVIDKLLDDFLQAKELQKFRKKVDKAMEFGIVFGVPDQSSSTFTFKSPIDMILIHPKGPDILKDVITNKVLPELKDGKVILNTNIPERILKEAGLTERQYVAQDQIPAKKISQKKKGRGI